MHQFLIGQGPGLEKNKLLTSLCRNETERKYSKQVLGFLGYLFRLQAFIALKQDTILLTDQGIPNKNPFKDKVPSQIERNSHPLSIFHLLISFRENETGCFFFHVTEDPTLFLTGECRHWNSLPAVKRLDGKQKTRFHLPVFVFTSRRES